MHRVLAQGFREANQPEVLSHIRCFSWNDLHFFVGAISLQRTLIVRRAFGDIGFNFFAAVVKYGGAQTEVIVVDQSQRLIVDQSQTFGFFCRPTQLIQIE